MNNLDSFDVDVRSAVKMLNNNYPVSCERCCSLDDHKELMQKAREVQQRRNILRMLELGYTRGKIMECLNVSLAQITECDKLLNKGELK